MTTVWLLVHSCQTVVTNSYFLKPCRHYQPFIPVSVIVAKAGEYPELRLKAWTSRVVTSFLCVALQDVSTQFTNEERNQELALATAATTKLSEWLLAIERCPRFMSVEQADNLHRLAWEFLVVF